MIELKKGVIQFIAFGLVGLSNTIVSQVVYMFCIALDCHYIIASIAGFILSVLNAFFWQNRFVFKQDSNVPTRVWWKVLLKTYISYAFTGLFLGNLLLVIWLDIIHIEKYTQPLTNVINDIGIRVENIVVANDIAPMLNMIITIPLNYIINKFWAYRQKEFEPNKTERKGKWKS